MKLFILFLYILYHKKFESYVMHKKDRGSLNNYSFQFPIYIYTYQIDTC